MWHSVAVLLLVALLAWFAKDSMLTAAALLLAGLVLAGRQEAFALLHQYAFRIGIFFLLLFLLLPLAGQKHDVLDMMRRLWSWQGLLAVAAGLVISWIGGKGVAVLGSQPAVLPGVLLGTLLAVLLLDGLPAGLIIAAGLLGLLRLAA